MTPTSKKRKSALLQNLVRDKILKSFPHLKPEDVITANNGQNGPDIKLSKVARKLVGVNFECKNQNKMKTMPADRYENQAKAWKIFTAPRAGKSCTAGIIRSPQTGIQCTNCAVVAH